MKRTILSLLSIPLLAMSLGAAPVMAGDHDHHDRGRHDWDGRHDNGHGRGHDDDRYQSRYDYREGYRDGYRADGHRTVVVERNYYRPAPSRRRASTVPMATNAVIGTTTTTLARPTWCGTTTVTACVTSTLR